jgi:hypothetical protein
MSFWYKLDCVALTETKGNYQANCRMVIIITIVYSYLSYVMNNQLS